MFYFCSSGTRRQLRGFAESKGNKALEYTSIFDMPPWGAIGISVLQTVTLFCLILLGLRLAGRRVFAERSPQDLITIVLVAEACNQGLADESAGYWGAFASVITLIVLGILTERIPFLRRLFDQKPVTIYDKGSLNIQAMRKHALDEADLDEAARKQGFSSYQDFNRIDLEGDGKVSGQFRSKTSR